ncbi:MAG: ABC transporter ATP-binding protein [Magnetococcus sp. THC-1_WYH]
MENDDAVITIQDLLFRWRPEGPPILDIAQWTAHRGERLFIKGASGSGKSTLLSLLGGVITPQSGIVRILGHNLPEMSNALRDRFRADHIGFIFQMFNLLPYLSPIENVLLPCRFSPLRRRRSLKRGTTLEVEARRILRHLGLDDDAQLTRSATELSVGQQQRVAAARALIGAPELLIADEPTSALDWDRRRVFLELLERECRDQGTTLVFVSHDASLEPLFDRAIALDDINRATPIKGA